MKSLTSIISILLITIRVFGQESDTLSVSIPINEKGLAEYTEVVIIDSISKNDIYINALEWVNKIFVSGKSVIQTTDKEGGIIIGKANTQTLTWTNIGIKKSGGYFSYVLSIYCKDNKYKYIIDNITHHKGDVMLPDAGDLGEKYPQAWTNSIVSKKQIAREWKSLQKQADNELKYIISDLKKNMAESKKKNDW
jgi:hypothetical protein